MTSRTLHQPRRSVTAIAWLLRLSVFALLLGACYHEARAVPTSWLLVVHAFSTDAGHTVALGSYVFRLPEDVYATDSECEAVGERRLRAFHAPVQANGTRLIPGYTCEAQP